MSPQARWIAYFVYLPSGGLTAAHRFTLRRLREARDAGLMVICAAPAPAAVPAELHALADALYWKGLGGFDFSAYALAIDAVTTASVGADLLLLNDSVFGPLGPVDALWDAGSWDLTGFTAAGAGENHIQSYAFILRALDPARGAALRPVFPPGRAFDDFGTVLLHQEMRLAAVAARSMSVGAAWYADPDLCADPSLFAALPLIEAGFPFLKRALLGKHRGIYPDQDVLDTLRRMGHPIPDSVA